jgi:hypothetical protein
MVRAGSGLAGAARHGDQPAARGLDAVIAKTAAPSGGKYLARPTLSDKSSPDLLSSCPQAS